jgi:hypothetical protein
MTVANELVERCTIFLKLIKCSTLLGNLAKGAGMTIISMEPRVSRDI